MKPIDYPEVLEDGPRRIRRWDVELASPIPTEGFTAVAEVLQKSIVASRLMAFGNLGRDLHRFSPRVRLERSAGSDDPTRLTVEISFDSTGEIGDCAFIANWMPLRVLHALCFVRQLQGVDASRWIPLVAQK